MDSLMADPSGGQSLADIESYLVNFNKEISDQSEGTYMLDEHEANNSPVYTNLGESVYPPTSDIQLDPHGHREDSGQVDGGNDNQVGVIYNGADDMLEEGETSQVMNAGNSSSRAIEEGLPEYQTVTLVPSANADGEVSYMLIVSQDDSSANHSSMTNGRADMSVFDFKEEGGATSKRRGEGNVSAIEPYDENNEENEESGTSAYGQKSGSTNGSGNNTAQSHNSTTPANLTLLRTSDQLMCNYCNYTSPKRFLLSRHMKTHSEERPHKCDICGRAFKTTVALTNHVNTHRGIKPSKCKECNAAFTTSGELIRHVRYIHTFEKPHKCNECDYASVELSKLKRHIRSHTGERPYQCPHCMYASPDTFKLKRHLRVHSGEKPYVCDICDMRFTQSNSLKSHKLIHSGQKPIFQCELCPTTCGRKTDLKNHVLKIHTSDRPLMCKKCGKSFPDRYTYRIHSRTHDGQKCFRCELCPYSAHLQRQLEAHILTHTGEKPYKCHRCDMAFRQKPLLKRHINLYHNPTFNPTPQRAKSYACTECNKSFAMRGNLLRHLAVHFPDNAEYQAALEGEVEDDEEGVVGLGEVGGGEEEMSKGERYSTLELDDDREEDNLYDGQYIHMNSDPAEPISVQPVLAPSASEAAAGEGMEEDESQRVYVQLGSCSLNALMLQQQQQEDEEEAGDETAAGVSTDLDQLQRSGGTAAVSEEYSGAEKEFNLVGDEENEAEEEQELTVIKKKKKKKTGQVKQSPVRSRKNSKNVDEDFSPVLHTPRGRGRSPKSPHPSSNSAAPVKGGKGRKHKAAEMEDSSNNDAGHSADLKADRDETQMSIKLESDTLTPKRSQRRSIKSSRLLDD